jgi:ligand-binding sensor domain-containing protein
MWSFFLSDVLVCPKAAKIKGKLREIINLSIDYLICGVISSINKIIKSFRFALILLAVPIFAQQPLYTQLGNNRTLNGIEIYGMSQDLHKNIWLTTSNGLYKYDGNEFTNYKNDELITNEFFQPFFTASNKMYFTDLTGDIYTLENEEIVIFKNQTIPNLYLDGWLFCSGDYLYISSEDSLYQLDSNAKQVALYGYKNAFKNCRVNSYKERDEFILYTKNLAQAITISNDHIQVKENESTYEENVILEKHIISNYHTFYLRQGDGNIKQLSHLGPYLKDKEGNLWKGFRNKKGIYIKRKNQDTEHHIFSQYSINYIFEDSEDNLWLGTRNNGIILISDLEDFSFGLEREFMGISCTSDRIYAISQNAFYEFDPLTTKLINKKVNVNQSNLYLFNSSQSNNQVFVQTVESIIGYKDFDVLYEYETQRSLTKNHHWISDSALLLATVRGTFLINPYTNNTLKFIGEFTDRSLDAQWIKDLNQYIVATSTGLKLYNYDGSFKNHILFNEKPVSIENLFWAGENLIGIGPSGRIFSINPRQNNIELLEQIDINFLVACIKHDGIIFIVDKHNVYTYNVKENKVDQLPILIPYNIALSGITIQNDALWISSSKGIIRFNLKNYSDQTHSPELAVKMYEGNGLMEIINAHQFKFNNNHISFKLKARDYKFQRFTKIRYKLQGAEKDFVEANSNELISYRALSPGKYIFKAHAVTPLGVKSSMFEYRFQIKHPWWQTWWFYTVVIAGIGLLYLIIYFARINNVREKRELKNRLQVSQINAIMAQMNPHFIFNCLNSIQDLILQEDIRSSNKYLGKFSELTRMTMHDSQEPVITLNRELELIKLYLELEALRFKNLNFTVVNSLSEEQCDLYSIPPMLVQPFVENALKHGLLHSTYNKRLELEILFLNKDLVFLVKDNGVGRTRATEIKKRQSKYRSFSGGAIAKRIRLINNQKQYEISLRITDQNNENKVGWTTIVELRFINFTLY